MLSIESVLICAIVATATWTVLGLAIATRVAPQPLALLFAPALGWSIHSVIALPVFCLVGMGRPAVLVAVMVPVAISVAALYQPRKFRPRARSWLLIASLGVAGVLALAPMAAIIPKETAGEVVLAAPIFDHSKIALIDEMIRSGVPPSNPFFGEVGAPDRVSYYYLWHFSAAMMAIATGVSGWEADAALTWFTAMASLLTMMALAVRFSGRITAASLVVALAATASCRPVLEALLGADKQHSLMGRTSGFGGWLFQVTWAPQHVASAMAVVLACILLTELTLRRGVLPIVFGLVATAAFQSSVWVGGVVLPLSVVAIGTYCCRSLGPAQRKSYLLRVACGIALAIALAAPFFYDQTVAASLRGSGLPISFAPVAVLGDTFADAVRKAFDPPAFWLLYLPVEFPAFYLTGMVAMFLLVKDRSLAQSEQRFARAMALLVTASLVTSWMFVSLIGENNDLGWRSVLPAVMLLIAFAAAGLARWLATCAFLPVVLSVIMLVMGLPGGTTIMSGNLGYPPSGENARGFARTLSLWQAVRRHTGIDERVANNPLFLGHLTPWPVNISWALLANRRSCYAGMELALPFALISAARRTEIEAQFVRVFAGAPSSDDIRELTGRYRCDVVVVAVEDGAWAQDPFATTEYYRLVESQPDAWRIYRATGQGRP